MSELTKFLNGLKKQFLTEKGTSGGKRRQFREYVGKHYKDDPTYFLKLALDAYMEAANFTWERRPRKQGQDLFSIAGYTVPEYLTRPANDYAPSDTDDDADEYEKVAAEFATVQDMIDDATLHLRKAAQSAAAAEQQMKAADEARRRARNNLSSLLRDLADESWPQAA